MKLVVDCVQFGDTRRMMDAGAQDFLLKPFSLQEFRDAVGAGKPVSSKG